MYLVAMVVATSCAGKAATTSTSTPPAAAASASAQPSETPIAIESNPPGDIPDSTQFVAYQSPSGHYSLQHPEGWAQTNNGSNVQFADKEHSIRVDIESATTARTPDTVRSMDEPKVRSSVRAFEEVKIATANVPGGSAVLFRYRANSNADPVTGKQVRLEVDRYEIYSSGRLAIVSLSAPAGSDNVDVWNQISQSFRFS